VLSRNEDEVRKLTRDGLTALRLDSGALAMARQDGWATTPPRRPGADRAVAANDEDETPPNSPSPRLTKMAAIKSLALALGGMISIVKKRPIPSTMAAPVDASSSSPSSAAFFSAATFRKVHPKEYLRRFLKENTRPDGRPPNRCRHVATSLGELGSHPSPGGFRWLEAVSDSLVSTSGLRWALCWCGIFGPAPPGRRLSVAGQLADGEIVSDLFFLVHLAPATPSSLPIHMLLYGIGFTSGTIETADGSALVRFGNTTMLCGIRAEVCEPSLQKPDDGWIGELKSSTL
jgi:hypothetical protein